MTWKLTCILCAISLLGVILHQLLSNKENLLELTPERMQEINRLERHKRDLLYEEHA